MREIATLANHRYLVVLNPEHELTFRAMDVQELAEEYRHKADSELLRLALTPNQLTQEAQLALTSALASRGIGGAARLEAARHQVAERKAENDRELRTFGIIHIFGLGRLHLGKANWVFDAETNIEWFKTTIFMVLLCFPLIPTGTYLVERNRALPDNLTGIQKLPLDWEQVPRVWVFAAGPF